jgi:hypothetical protein
MEALVSLILDEISSSEFKGMLKSGIEAGDLDSLEILLLY